MDANEGANHLGEPIYRNPDGSLATWMEPLPLAVRRRAAAKWAVGSLLLAIIVWGLQHLDGALFSVFFFVGLVPLALGIVSARLIYLQAERRRYSMEEVGYTTSQRLRRAAVYWALSFCMVCAIWGIQYANGDMEAYWFFAWPALLPAAIGTWRFTRRSEVAMTPAAVEAKKAIEAQELARAAAGSATPTLVEKIFELAWVRYPSAVALLYAAYHYAFESTENKATWVAVGLVVFAGMCAREVSVVLLGVGLIAGIGWVIVSVLSALPVSAAIVLGALIIASAASK